MHNETEKARAAPRRQPEPAPAIAPTRAAQRARRPDPHAFADETMRQAIREGLQARPRKLPASLLYDALGSSLFEAITFLPEYEVTRADFALLERHSRDVFDALGGPIEVCELGPGAGSKAALVLRQLIERQPRVPFTGVDVSRTALDQCQHALEAIPGVVARAQQARYLDGLAAAPRTEGHRRLVLFLGSNLSNFERAAAARFFHEVRAHLQPSDGFLLATDLDKAPEQLIPAYDDALGVTAAFNRNVLLRLNRDWGADFPLDAFRHRAHWNAQARRIEMHLEAERSIHTRVLDIDVLMAPGETLWTESSHRFTTAELRGWGEAAGFRCAGQWQNAPWAFAHSLFVVP